MTENEKYLNDHFLISIKSGFESLEDVIEAALETVEEEGWQREISEEWVTETFTRAYQKNEQASKSWEAVTDFTKLTQAFDLLCENKILALHNIGFTDSEAIYDTLDVWKDLEDEGVQLIGYCYYHGQALERVIETGELTIGFSGRKENNEKETIIIGNRIIEVLKEAGFSIKWNHSAAEKITITDFNWQNIFTSYEDVEEKWGHDRVFQLMK